jgi:hypothetical protein
MFYRYSVRYRRAELGQRIYRLTVTARDADEARELARARDPEFWSSVAVHRRGQVVPEKVAS